MCSNGRWIGVFNAEPRRFRHRLALMRPRFSARHQYVTVISSQDRVLHVADDRKSTTLDAVVCLAANQRAGQAGDTGVDGHWGRPYIDSTLRHVPEAQRKIAFDKFPVAQHLGDAVGQGRRGRAQKALRALKVSRC